MLIFRGVQYARLAVIICTAIVSFNSAACDSRQQIRLTVGDRQIDQWHDTSDAMHHAVLPNGFKLGVKIEQPSREYYESTLKRLGETKVHELVRISLYDETGTTPRLMTYTFGGVNSAQGYGPRGGADRVDEVGDAGIVFKLSKRNCLDAAAVAAMPTAATLKQTDEKPQPSAENALGIAVAVNDAKSGKYQVIFPRGQLSVAQLNIIKTEIEKAGLLFTHEDEASKSNSPGFNKGYSRGMRDAIKEKFGEAHMKNVEANIKAGMAAIAATSASQ